MDALECFVSIEYRPAFSRVIGLSFSSRSLSNYFDIVDRVRRQDLLITFVEEKNSPNLSSSQRKISALSDLRRLVFDLAIVMLYHNAVLTSVDYPLIFCKATGGGAFKFADVFKERLGVTFDKEDEMDCLVSGANFLLRVRFSKCPLSTMIVR